MRLGASLPMYLCGSFRRLPAEPAIRVLLALFEVADPSLGVDDIENRIPRNQLHARNAILQPKLPTELPESIRELARELLRAPELLDAAGAEPV